MQGTQCVRVPRLSGSDSVDVKNSSGKISRIGRARSHGGFLPTHGGDKHENQNRNKHGFSRHVLQDTMSTIEVPNWIIVEIRRLHNFALFIRQKPSQLVLWRFLTNNGIFSLNCYSVFLLWHERTCHTPNIKQRISNGISANISNLIGAVTVFSHRSIRISYKDSRSRTAADTARCSRRIGKKTAAMPNRTPPNRERIMIHCSTYM